MKKRLVVGDIHGHGQDFEHAYILEQPDEVVILGDYSDPYEKEIDSEKVKESFNTLLIIRVLHYAGHPKGTFHMLLGNHDLHYILPSEEYSRKDFRTGRLMKPLYDKCIDTGALKIAYIDYINKIIYSHAGVTNTWLKEICNGASLEEINNLSFDYFKFTYGTSGSKYGDDPENGPLWVRPRSLSQDPYVDKDGYIWDQIFGHTKADPISFSRGPILLMNVRKYNERDYENGKFKIMDCFPRYYMIQTLDDDGKLLKTEVKELIWDHEDPEKVEIP